MAKMDWIKERWRPAMGWQYMLVCLFDFIVAPIFWSLIQVVGNGTVSSQWQPLTLQGGGFYHITMATVLGISAWSRGQEKMAGVDKTPEVK